MIYLDNSATTKPSPACIAKINESLSNNWGNPSALYGFGFEAEREISAVRKSISSLIKCREDEVFFTSCGTESNNTAIFSAVNAGKHIGKRIVTTAIEHPSILEPLKKLGGEGYEIVYLNPKTDGNISKEDIINSITEDTVLVCMMLVNNETGAVLPVKAAAERIKSIGAKTHLHCDAVQGFGKLQIDVNSLGVDTLSISAHKIHGPKGIGVLYSKKSNNLKPLILGGGQEKGKRSGTESTHLIAGLGGALSDLGSITENYQKAEKLNIKAREILGDIEGVCFNSSEYACPYILNFSFIGYRSETVLHFLEGQNIYVSSGSACSKGKGSYVLSAMGLDRKRVDSAIRLSFSRDTDVSDIENLAAELKRAKKILRRAN